MLRYGVFLIVVLLRVCLCHDSDVFELNPASFYDTVTKSKQTWVVQFYTKNCPFCEEFAPEYEQVATALSKSDVKVGRMDGDKYQDFVSRYNVRSFPSIKIFRPGSVVPIEYHGRRRASSLLAAIENITHSMIKRDLLLERGGS